MLDLPPCLVPPVRPELPRMTRHGAELPCFCIRNAFAACVYRSAAFSHFSVFPPKSEKPPLAPDAALSAYSTNLSIHWFIERPVG